jgi:putative ABC transport system substrate-binding protein
VPIVFPVATDPVGAGWVQSQARPGGNATGFMGFEYSLSGKWLELLKQIAPGVTRVAVLRDSTQSSGIGQFAAIQARRPPRVVVTRSMFATPASSAPSRLRAARMAVQASSRSSIVAAGCPAQAVTAVYYERNFAAAGGLSPMGLISRPILAAAGYVDRIQGREAGRPCRCRRRPVLNLKTARGWPRRASDALAPTR